MKPNCSLVIGSSGFIGKELTKDLYSKNTYTISLNYKKALDTDNHFFIDISNKTQFKKTLDSLKNKFKKFNVYFLAGESSVERSLLDPKDSFDASVIAFSNVIDYLKDFDSSLVYASSGSIYDSRNKDRFIENDTLYPPSPYAASKYASEGLALSYFEAFNLDIKIARIFSVYGENMSRFFLYDLIKKINSGESSIVLKGNGRQQRDYLHVSDVSKGLKIIMEKGKPGEIYNLCSGEPTRLDELTSQVLKTLKNEDLEIIWDHKESKGTRENWYGNNKKISEIGFKASSGKSLLNKTITELNQKMKRI